MTLLRLVRGSRSRWSLEGEAMRVDLDTATGGRAHVACGDVTQVVLSPVLTMAGDHGPVPQVCDGDAEVVPLLQAGGLAAIRCHHTWRRGDGTYLGDGFVEYWLGPRLHVAVGVRVLGEAVVAAGIEARVEGRGLRTTDDASPAPPDAPTYAMLPVEPGASTASPLDWVRARPPFYARWMGFVEQWSLDPDAHGLDPAGETDDRDGILFPFRAKGGDAGLVAAGVLGLGAIDAIDAGAHVPQGRLDPSSGAWQVDLGDGETCVVVPAGPAVPVVMDISGQRPGPIAVTVDDDAETTLVSRAGGVDDPVVALRRLHDQVADAVVVRTRRRPDRDVRVDVRPASGVHAAVQYRDERRRVTVHDERDPVRPVAVVETSTARLVDVRLPGADVAVADLPLHWLRYLGKSAAHVADHVTEVEVTSWGPEVVDMRLASESADGATSSTVRLVIPRRPDRLEVQVSATLRGASAWRASTAEFADVFPEWGIDPDRWRYDHLALVRATDTRVVDMREPFPGLDDVLDLPMHALEAYQHRSGVPEYGPWPLSPGDAVLLHGGAPGDVVVTLGDVRPATLDQAVTYCEHWGDVHLDVVRRGRLPAPTEVARGELALPDEVAAAYTLTVLPAIPGGLEAAVDRVRGEVAGGAR